MAAGYRNSVTPEVFCIAWNTSSSTKEVADKLRLSPSTVRTRASHYRKLGVKLKSFV